MIGLGIFLACILGLASLVVGLAYWMECWRCSQLYTMFAFVLPVGCTILLIGLLVLAGFSGSGALAALGMLLSLLLIPLGLVGTVFQIMLLVKFWAELRNLFFASFLINCLAIIPAVIVGAGMAERAQDMAEQQQEEAEEIAKQQQIAQENEVRRLAAERERRIQQNNNQNTRITPPPRPDEPIFEPDQLVAGLPSAGTSAATWPTLTVPDIDLSNGKALDLHGYRLMVPDVYKIDRVEPLQDQGMQWTILGGLHGNGRPIELIIRVLPLAQQADGRVFEPSWSETLGKAGVSRADYQIEYGQIGTIPFARCANELVKTGHGIGQVRYLGKPSPQNPQRIEIEFATNPQGYGRAHALTCEAIARSLTRNEREMMPKPSDPAVLLSPLARQPTTAIDPAQWQVRGPFALAVNESSGANCSPWSRDGQAWQTTAQFTGARDCSIQITLQPDDNIPADRIMPVALNGPLQIDDVVCAYGGEGSYVKLWNDAVFARIEHNTMQQGDASKHFSVSYHGYLNQNRIDITLTNRDDSAVTIAQLEDTLMRSRLATVPELAESQQQAEWLKELLADEQPAFIVAGGVDATEALVLDERGGIAVSPQYDAELRRMFTVYPQLDDQETLADYEQWTSGDDNDEMLGQAQKLGELEIQPIKELRESHHAKQLSWQTKTKTGTVGMTVHVEDLKVSDRDIETPLVEVAGRLRIRLGRRVVQPSQTPEVSYRELRNLRIWRVNIPASGRQKIARCHYLALVPDKMIVISTSYHADRPEQLEAFDASVATLVYQDGQPLKREIPAE